MADLAALATRICQPQVPGQTLAAVQLRLSDGAGGVNRARRGAGRLPLIAESLASGALVEQFADMRLDSPMAYWLVLSPRSTARPEVLAFCQWLQAEAAETRQATGDDPPAASLSPMQPM